MDTASQRSGVNWGFVFALVLSIIIVLLFWATPFVFPVRLFVTIVHELSHAIAAVATGGQVVSVSISPDASGLAQIQGGNSFIVGSAGYLGSVLFGSLLLSLTQKGGWSRVSLAVLGVALLVADLLAIRNPFGFAATLALGIGFIALAAKCPDWLLRTIVYLLATLNCLYALTDLAGVVLLSQSGTPTDAASMARLTSVPAIFWALLWLAMGILALVLVGRRLVRG